MTGARTRFLADESCDYAVVRALRARDIDIIAIAEAGPSASDRDVLSLARNDGRILVTEDKDFGWLVYVSLERSAGVVLLRYRPEGRASIVDSVVALATEQPEQLIGSFTVVQPGRIRFSLRP
jgi:hypothetical protein